MINDQVVHETLDGETVVINLASGTYYSLEGSGADLWARLLAGEPANATAAALATEHGADRSAILAAVVDFHRQLLAEGLTTGAVAEAAPDGATPASAGASPTPAPTGAPGEHLGSFVAPTIRAYNDLQEHLLLDPVHDVERGAGWPAVPARP